MADGDFQIREFGKQRPDIGILGRYQLQVETHARRRQQRKTLLPCGVTNQFITAGLTVLIRVTSDDLADAAHDFLDGAKL